MKKEVIALYLLFFSFIITSCSYNPFIGNNRTTGSPVAGAVGAGAGAGAVAWLGGSKPLIAIGGIGGGMFGYYITTLRHDAGPIIRVGGNVYQVGQQVGIYIPTDRLFESNTSELLPDACKVLDAVIVVLQRFPKNNILISGNTSGFYKSRFEQRLSEKRAQAVSAYLWKGGIGDFKNPGNDMRKLNYVGYGDYFPIANHYTEKGIRANSRIQITSYPSDCDLHLDQKHIAVANIGATDDQYVNNYYDSSCESYSSDGSCASVSDKI